MDFSSYQLPQSPTRASSIETGLGSFTPPQTPREADSSRALPRVDDEQCDPLDASFRPSKAVFVAPTRPGLRRQLDVENAESGDYVMVIGGLGYIGSHTTLELLKEGLNVVVVDDLSNSYLYVLSRIRSLAEKYCVARDMVQPQLRFHNMDYRSAEMHSLLIRYASSRSKISGVIHFAAFKSVSESIAHPLAYYRNNICGLVELLTTMQEVGIKNFVFSSSATVYGEQANAGKPLQEDDLVHFNQTLTDTDGNVATLVNGARGLTSPYGRTKYFAEAILADVAHADPSMRITALRYFNPVGCHPSGILREDPRQKPTNLFPVIASVMKGSQNELEIFGNDWATRDGTAIRDFIHVMDLAQGHIAALVAASPVVNPNREAFRAYNLGSGTGMTVAEVVSSFEKASNLKVPVVLAPRRDGDVGFCVAATSRAETELGWKTTKRVEECARDTWTALALSEHLEE
jgi:UDP-glucose 4-epimerase